MKQLTSYNRVAGYLNKVFDLLNEEFFECELSRPTITIQSTPKAYGHFSLREDTWISKVGGTHEINIGAGTLSRPIEEVAATLLHEMVHYFNYVNGIQDCSRGNTYHNRKFRDAAEAHGLIVDHHDKYGWTITTPSDELLEVILKYDLTDILINRNEFDGFQITEGDYLALEESKLFGTDKDLDTLLRRLAEADNQQNAEFISIFYGEDVTEEDAARALSIFEEVCPDAEITLLPGGQPVYYYMISAE